MSLGVSLTQMKVFSLKSSLISSVGRVIIGPIIGFILIKIFNNKTSDEIIKTDLFFINEIGLNRFIGTQRSNGLESMEKKIKLMAITK